MKNDNLVQIDRVTFGYDQRVILSDITMAFPRGKVIAIMGGSGCGKTTLLRLIGGTLTPQRGTVSFDGSPVNPRDRESLYALRRRVGMLFQFGALFTDMTVFDNVAFPLREHTTLPEPMIRDLVMARRVALARAIALDPELIMYDEPFAGLDPISLGVAANLIRRLNDATGATSLVVSHDVHECFLISDYVYVISSGRIVGHGTPAEVQASDDPEVRQFIDGEPDGPVKFHYPAAAYGADLGLRP